MSIRNCWSLNMPDYTFIVKNHASLPLEIGVNAKTDKEAWDKIKKYGYLDENINLSFTKIKSEE